MADYTIYVRPVQEDERTIETVRAGLKSETLEADWYGDVASVRFDGDTAIVVMTGATDEVARRMEGRIIPGLDTESH